MITTSILYRVFFIRNGKNTGTAFILEFDDRQYLISAKHIFEDKKSREIANFNLFYKDSWINSTNEKVYFHENAMVDVAVIPLNKPLYKGKDIQANFDKIAIGQDVYFLGFPYGLRMNSLGSSHPFPLPLIKKGILSAVIKENGTDIFILDGHNNPGFSGGPAVFKNPADGKEYIFGVISAYIKQNGKIESPFGDLDYHENSGLIVSYSSEYANQIIDRIN